MRHEVKSAAAMVNLIGTLTDELTRYIVVGVGDLQTDGLRLTSHDRAPLKESKRIALLKSYGGRVTWEKRAESWREACGLIRKELDRLLEVASGVDLLVGSEYFSEGKYRIVLERSQSKKQGNDTKSERDHDKDE